MSSPSLPIAAHRQQILTSVARSHTTIIIAPPGTGKTTEVPQYLIDAMPGRVYVLEPRRLAARLSAERVAQLRGCKIGEEVGYWIRHDRRFSPQTRLVFLTEGVFVQLLRFNPNFDGVAAVVLDEVHERNINTDVAIALLRQRQLSGKSCPKIVLMSATLAADEFEAFFVKCERVEVAAVNFPVALHYAPMSGSKGFDARLLARHIQQNILPHTGPGNILVFLTGIGEIRSLESALMDLGCGRQFNLLALASTIDSRDQAKVFESSDRPKMILATNIAETSLTIPGITTVIDTGLAKISGFTSWSALPTIEIRPVSQSSCIQRAGRAGRTAPGQAFRLFSEAEFLRRPVSDIPELKRSDLVPVLLDTLTILSSDQPDLTVEDISTSFPWLSPPDPSQWQAATDILRMLRLIDGHGRLTSAARSVAVLPMHPRLSAFWDESQNHSIRLTCILLMVMVSESFHEKFSPSDRGHLDCDIRPRVMALWQFLRGETHPGIARHEADRWRAQMRPSFVQLCRILRQTENLLDQEPDLDCISEILLRGFPDRLAKISKDKDPDCRSYRFCRGGGGELHRQSLAQGSPLIICMSLKEKLSSDKAESLLIERAASISEDDLLISNSPLLSCTEILEPSARGNPQRFEVYQYGEIEIKRRLLQSSVAETSDQLAARLKASWPQPFQNSDDLENYHARARLYLKHFPDAALPIFEAEMLELLIESIAQDYPSWQQISLTSLTEAISAQIDYQAWQELNRELPTKIKLPNGKSVQIDYISPAGPLVTGPIQDFYGCAELPKLCLGKESLSLELIGPNKRPIQRTRDLAGFWKNTYPQLWKEYSRNYPRHYWPQDPSRAAPYLLMRHLPKT
jgi:ATP-dependent helicase HrpB